MLLAGFVKPWRAGVPPSALRGLLIVVACLAAEFSGARPSVLAAYGLSRCGAQA